VTVEIAEDGTRYWLLETVRQYAADRLAAAGGTQAARDRHALAFLHMAERERGLSALARDHGNFRAALEWSVAQDGQAGPRLAHALGGYWLARGLLAEGRDWLERALAQPLADQALRAGLLRLLGATLFECGDLDRAEAVLAKGSAAAATASAPALQARIGALLADLRNMQGRSNAETWLTARRPPRYFWPKATWRAWPRRGCWRAGHGFGWMTRQPPQKPWSALSPAPGKAATTVSRCAPATGSR